MEKFGDWQNMHNCSWFCFEKKVQNIMESSENETGIWISALVDIILYVCLKNLDCWKSKSISHAEGSSKSFKELVY